jgi:EmrB/QacA subfamily drug resistance transporter
VIESLFSSGGRHAAAWLGEAKRPRMVRDASFAPWLAVGTVCFGAFMGQLNASIVTLTFPALQHQFHASLAATQWVALIYLLALTGLLPVAGRLADAAGRKRLYIYGAAAFTLASVACALAPTMGLLIAFRAVQAVGAALLQANSVALVVSSVPADKVGPALGVQAAAQALGLALGPFAGGLLVASVGWHWVFWINVPVGVAIVVAGRYLLPRTRDCSPLGRFDLAGALLLLAGVAALLLALSGVSGLRLSAPEVALLVAGSVASFAGFVRREARVAHPLIDLTLVRPAAVSLGLLGAACAYLLLFGPLALFPQLLQAHGAAAGLALTALPVGFAAGALRGEKTLPRGWSSRARCLLGAVIAIAALPLLAVDPLALGWIVPWLAVLGFGLGLFIPANNAAVMTAVPPHAAGTTGGLVNVSRGLGTALAVAVVTLCLHGAAAGPAALAGRVALTALVPFGVVAALAALLAGRADRRLA